MKVAKCVHVRDQAAQLRVANRSRRIVSAIEWPQIHASAVVEVLVIVKSVSHPLGRVVSYRERATVISDRGDRRLLVSAVIDVVREPNRYESREDEY